MTKHETPLQQVYNARSDDELADAYGAWAASYDRDTLEEGYILPFFVPAFLARHANPAAVPVLDAGVGTGLSGPYLKALGYEDLAGMDMSGDMLEMARAKGCYRELKQAVLGETLPWKDNHFAAVMSAGVFTQGHAPASGLDELVRITRSGGVGVFNIRLSIFESGGFQHKLDELQNRGLIKSIEISPPFASFALGNEEVVGQVHVIEVV